MKCPVCQGTTIRVLETRPSAQSEYRIYRRRECQGCLTRMTTSEYIMIDSIPKHVRKKIEHEQQV